MTTPPSPLELSRDQRALLGLLRDLDKRYTKRCADMFLGALRTLADSGNPDRVAQAALSMRGLLDKLPECLPKALVFRSSRDAVSGLDSIASAFGKAQGRSKCYDSATQRWAGQIDRPLQLLLSRVAIRVRNWNNQPTRHDANVRFIRNVRPAGPISPEGEQDFLEQWKNLYGFFNAALHHGSEPTANEMEDRLNLCSVLLLYLLREPAVARLDALDQIIAEGESDA